MTPEENTGIKIFKEAVKAKREGDSVMSSFQKSLDRLNREASKAATQLYEFVFKKLEVNSATGLIENTTNNLAMVSEITAGLEPITDRYRIDYGQLMRDYRGEVLGVAAQKEDRIGFYLDKAGIKDGGARALLTPEAFSQISILTEKNFRKINALLLKWKETVYDLFLSGVNRGLSLIDFRNTFYNENGSIKVGSSLEEESTAAAMIAVTEQQTAFARQKAKENNYTYCWNANPMDRQTKEICLSASLAGVISEGRMSTDYGFPPRFVCRCEIVYTRPEWVDVNKGVNAAIAERREKAIQELMAAPRTKKYWYWKGQKVMSPTGGGAMYKETADKLALLNKTTVPEYTWTPPTGGVPPVPGGAPVPPPAPVPTGVPSLAEQKEFGAKIKSIALESEPQTTRVLQNIAKSNEGVDLVGLEYRIKSSKSMFRKIGKELNENPGWTLAELQGEDVNDILRYTMRIGENKYTTVTHNTLATLKDQGHEVLMVKNYWGKEGYKGINAVLRNSQGTKYELQFHTPRSLVVKEEISHPLYEKIRVSTDPAKIKMWTTEMDEAWKSVNVPKGVLSISK